MFSSKPSPPCSPTTAIAVFTALATLVAGCASGPETGVRPDFEQNRVVSVAVVPFYASSTFGLDSQRVDTLETRYEKVATQALRRQGFQVVDSSDFRHRLTQQGVWEIFDEGLHLHNSLTRYFEPRPDSGRQSIEITTLRRLVEKGAVRADALLIGEVVYHTEGTCRTSADDHLSRSQITVTDSAPSELPRPCVTSHIRAKLVEPERAQTMWFNQMLVETHTGEVDDETVENTILRTVDEVFEREDGLAPLIPRREDGDVHADDD